MAPMKRLKKTDPSYFSILSGVRFVHFFSLSHIYGDIDVAAIWKCPQGWTLCHLGWKICPVNLEEVFYQLKTGNGAVF